VGFATGSANVPIVAAAILYDLGIGKPNVRPTLAMGEAAAAAATADAVAEGCVGAGTGATVGKILGMKHAMKSGLGTFTVSLPNGLLVSALAAVNAVGDVRDPQTGRIVAGARKTPDGREFLDTVEHMKQSPGAPNVDRAVKNTTLAVVATNARLNKVQARKLAQLAALGMARTINPVNTMADGDTTFALALGEREADINVLGVAAAEALSGAILRAVKLARTMGGVPGLAS
jgi:L-aminopeptidase/D-esterase-like protein